MKRETHFLFAFVIGFFLTGFLNIFGINIMLSIKERIANALFCSCGALLPDLIELPEKKKHRAFFHSFTFFLLLLIFFIYFLKYSDFRIASFLLGYLSHLFLDFFTSFKLPII
jgi:membrane-bound metal-dependent hydrolase YbcI (DUF457 family)